MTDDNFYHFPQKKRAKNTIFLHPIALFLILFSFYSQTVSTGAFEIWVFLTVSTKAF